MHCQMTVQHVHAGRAEPRDVAHGALATKRMPVELQSSMSAEGKPYHGSKHCRLQLLCSIGNCLRNLQKLSL